MIFTGFAGSELLFVSERRAIAFASAPTTKGTTEPAKSNFEPGYDLQAVVILAEGMRRLLGIYRALCLIVTATRLRAGHQGLWKSQLAARARRSHLHHGWLLTTKNMAARGFTAEKDNAVSLGFVVAPTIPIRVSIPSASAGVQAPIAARLLKAAR